VLGVRLRVIRIDVIDTSRLKSLITSSSLKGGSTVSRKRRKRFVKILRAVIGEMLSVVVYVLSISIYPISKLLIIALPYLMLFIGVEMYKVRGYFAIGGELFIPIVVFLISWFLKSFADKIGKGEAPPVPSERFTTEDGDGEVSCEYSRMQEMLLFVNDYEKWLERKGLL